MNQLRLPWLELSAALPLLGALVLAGIRSPDRARRISLFVAGAVLLTTLGAWLDFRLLHLFEAHDRWDLLAAVCGGALLVVDELSAPLLPLAALLYFMTFLATLRAKATRFSFSLALMSESILLSCLACRAPWGVVAALLLQLVPLHLELRGRRQSTRLFWIHFAPFAGCLVAGQSLVSVFPAQSVGAVCGMTLLGAALLIRGGAAPLHCWVNDLFARASFGSALLFLAPMVWVYAALRLLFPVAPLVLLQAMALLALITALYAAGMSLVQRAPRQVFAWLLLSHSSLVLVGLDLGTPVGLTGALSLWIAVSLSLTGFGLTLRSIESRMGRLSLERFHGLYEHLPTLAAFFLLTGLASVGFPGTIGFVGAELIVEGAVQASPLVGVAVVVVAALNGLSVVQTYFRLFTGARFDSTLDIRARPAERIAILVLTLLILGGGLLPQPGIASRYHAARELIEQRQQTSGAAAPEHHALFSNRP